jgi:hypothetical protein
MEPIGLLTRFCLPQIHARIELWTCAHIDYDLYYKYRLTWSTEVKQTMV